MAKSKIHVGLEIGTTKICMVVGEVKSDNAVKILGVGETPSEGVRKGEISNYSVVRSRVKAALIEAEDVSDVDIHSVFLAVTGEHINGTNNKGTFRLPEDERCVTMEHVEEAKDIARHVVISSENACVHSLIRHYWLDGQEHSTVPVGLLGKCLEADYHIVHGVTTRIQNSIKCVRDIPLDVDDVVFSPIASALVVLNRQQKDAGALVIDMGGGTTDYVLYLNGAIIASGCIPFGGETVTNDIHLVTKVPLSKAERIKKLEGDASGDPAKSLGKLTIPDDKGFPEHSIERGLLNHVIRCRLEEILILLINQLPHGSLEKVGAGVFLTGGASLMRGLGELVGEVFRLPVYRPERSDITGVHAYFRDPQYATAVGLIRFAQMMDEERKITAKPRIFGKPWKIF
jgi:cell division protein FtsA